MWRRQFLAILAALPAFADKLQSVNDLFTSLASALSEGNARDFMKYIDSGLAGRETLSANIGALADQTQVLTSIDILRDDGNDQRRSLELDWLLRIRSLEETGPSERREQAVKCVIERRGRKWKVVSLEPLDFFSPLKLKP